jgi:hypothetical protein
MKLARPAFVIAVVIAMVAACSGTSGSATPSPAAAGDGPIGAWQVVITEDDFRAAGLTDAGMIAESAGTFTWTILADGTYTETQQSDQPIRWPVFKGTWSETEAGKIRLRTTFPSDFVGESIDLGWEREGGELRLTLIAPQDPVMRVHFESHPWLPAP